MELGRDSGLWAFLGWGLFEFHVQPGCDTWEGVQTRAANSGLMGGLFWCYGSGNSEGGPSATGDFCCLLWTLQSVTVQGQGFLMAVASWWPAKGYLCFV